MILYRSHDDGTFYRLEHIDDTSRFLKVEVNDVITLTPNQLCGRDGDLLEILYAAKQAKVIDN